MIQLREDICWVVAADGKASAFDGPRLARSIQRAAAAAGLHDWWPADAVAEAVYLATRECCRNGMIHASEVVQAVVHMLTMIGSAEIAQSYRQRHQIAEIRLDQFNDPSGLWTELSFFQQLDTALTATAAGRELRALQVRGLRACVMRLRGARHWSRSCRQLAEQIVTHVRQRIAHHRAAHPSAVRLVIE